jgi:hypothetical protein
MLQNEKYFAEMAAEWGGHLRRASVSSLGLQSF